MTNPDPDRITDEMWKLWESRPNLTWKLSGIYADKKGYHSTVLANKKKWPKDNYSIKLPLDLSKINQGKARAIDLTMTDSEMVKWTENMMRSALDPEDNRLAAVREFYGTLDNKTVFGLIKDNTSKPWRRSSADKTHLWHGHMSIFTSYVANWLWLAPILSVWAGQTLEEWRLNDMFLPKLGDSGEPVIYWQQIHNIARHFHNPPSPEIDVDGDYGPNTASAFTEFYKKFGGKGGYKGEVLSGWMAMKYMQSFTIMTVPEPTIPPPALNEEQLRELVNNWLSERVPDGLTITGDLKGKVTLP